MSRPELVTITFAGDSFADMEEAWGQWAIQSDWLRQVGADYGVGAGDALPPYRVPGSPPSSFGPVEATTLLNTLVDDGGLTAPGGATIYAIYIPDGVSLTKDEGDAGIDAGRSAYCGNGGDAYSGFHRGLQVGGRTVAVAFIGRCAGFWPGLDLSQQVQRTASHELIEAATNPYPDGSPDGSPGPAYYVPSNGPLSPPLALERGIGEAEVGDTCAGSQVDIVDAGADAGFVAQRIWSNRAAQAGADPCVPPAAAAYFSVTPTDGNTSLWYTIDAGSEVLITLEAWSEAPVDSWYVRYAANPPGSLSVHTRDAGGHAFTDGGLLVNTGSVFTIGVSTTADAGSRLGLEIRSATPSALSDANSIREASYHFFPLGFNVR